LSPVKQTKLFLTKIRGSPNNSFLVSFPQPSHRKKFSPPNGSQIVNCKSQGGFHTSHSLLYLTDLPEFSVNICFINRSYLRHATDIFNNRTTWTKKANSEEATFETAAKTKEKKTKEASITQAEAKTATKKTTTSTFVDTFQICWPLQADS